MSVTPALNQPDYPLRKHLPHPPPQDLFWCLKRCLKEWRFLVTHSLECSFLLFAKERHKYVTQQFLEQIRNELENCVIGSPSQGRGRMPAAGLMGPSASLSSPVPSAILPGAGAGIANISRQFPLISQCPAAVSENTPTPLLDLKDRKWSVPAVTSHPAKAINRAGQLGPAHWGPAASESTQHTTEPSQLCREGYLRSQGAQLMSL